MQPGEESFFLVGAGHVCGPYNYLRDDAGVVLVVGKK
jgi:uncharacterized protein YbaP (TraB family)